MKIGVMYANVAAFGTRDGARAIAEASEKHGIESLWTVEHVVVPQGYESSYPYSKDGKMPGGETSPIPDPLIWLSHVAAHTERVRLGTGILIVPQRNPVVLAKAAATLDQLSGGRLMLGIGIGWLKEEFEAIGVPFAERVSRTEETVEALRALWSEDETHHGTHFSFTQARSFPKPVQPGGVPIVVGGHSTAAAERAGRIGDGFFPARSDRIEELVAVARQAATDAGRDPDALEITAGGKPTVEVAERLRDAGVHRMVVPLPTFDPADCDRAFGEIADGLLSKL